MHVKQTSRAIVYHSHRAFAEAHLEYHKGHAPMGLGMVSQDTKGRWACSVTFPHPMASEPTLQRINGGL
jgi:hypothetical protein